MIRVSLSSWACSKTYILKEWDHLDHFEEDSWAHMTQKSILLDDSERIHILKLEVLPLCPSSAAYSKTSYYKVWGHLDLFEEDK